MLILIFVLFVFFVATRFFLPCGVRALVWAAVHFNAEDAEGTEGRREKREWAQCER